MKHIWVDMGHCNTCGKKLRAYVDEYAFLTNLGEEENTITVEAHCGQGGHASKRGYLTREDFDAAADGDII